MLFEKKAFSGWNESINQVAMTHLKHPLFKKDPGTGGCEQRGLNRIHKCSG